MHDSYGYSWHVQRFLFRVLKFNRGSQKCLYGLKTDLVRVQHTSNYDSIYTVSFSPVNCGFSFFIHL